LTIVDNFDYGRIIEYNGDIFELLEKYGQMPLPPYVSYSNEKESDYQPSMAKIPGSVASPTASLHFSPRLLQALENN
jgi:S-adenosylmethionine:tRNA ribosyltransferase-isomerase